jgi:hypothetical protein
VRELFRGGDPGERILQHLLTLAAVVSLNYQLGRPSRALVEEAREIDVRGARTLTSNDVAAVTGSPSISRRVVASAGEDKAPRVAAHASWT